MADEKSELNAIETDEADRSIINVLLANSRLSIRKIAAKTGISAATCMHRIRRLEHEQVIKKYTTVIDYDKLGYDMIAIIEIRVQKGQLINVEKKIATHPNVQAVFDVTGDFDASVLARFKNRRAMDAFVKKIQTYEFVERTNTKLVLNEIKNQGISL